MPRVTVAIPTRNAGRLLSDCLNSLSAQIYTDFEITVLDNSGSNKAADFSADLRVSVVDMGRNAGFGAAINCAVLRSSARYIATLNDDTIVHPGWLGALVAAAEEDSRVGMFASRIQLIGTELLDSAGMLIAKDGSSKQRGRLAPASRYDAGEEVLLPSACAALYRRSMLDDIGLFDETFFLYCEDTDLGLRARWRGWSCRYVPMAIAGHHYSASTGPASRLKARCVERNRLRVVVRNFPARFVVPAFFASLIRYYWHFREMQCRKGLAGEWKASGFTALSALLIVWSAHLSLILQLPSLIRGRRQILSSARLRPTEFANLLRTHAIGMRQLAEET